MDGALIGLFVPQAAKENQSLLPRFERLQARPEFHAGALPLRPPVIRVETHTGECDKRTSRWQTSSVGSLARSE